MRTVQGKWGIPVTLSIKLKMKSPLEQIHTYTVHVYMFFFILPEAEHTLCFYPQF